MNRREYHEALWQQLPAGRRPRAFAARSRFLLEHLEPGQRVLDLGCGEGAFAALMVEHGVDVLAVDIAEEPLRRAAAAHPELELRLLDGEGDWQLEDGGFDRVWAGEVIAHVADTAGWLSEVRRVLRPGGALLLSTPLLGRRELLAAALSRAAFARTFEPRAQELRHYDRATLTALMADFGFAEHDVHAFAPRGEARVLLACLERSRF